MRNLILFVAIAMAAGAGCQNVNSVERAVPVASPSYVSDKRIITDYTLAKSLAIVSVYQTTVSGNLLKIQVQVENLSSRTNNLRYRIQWIDRDGMVVDSPLDVWKPLTLQGRERSSVSGVAPTPAAVDFTIKFQES